MLGPFVLLLHHEGIEKDLAEYREAYRDKLLAFLDKDLAAEKHRKSCAPKA